jgi:hypothetical protein
VTLWIHIRTPDRRDRSAATALDRADVNEHHLVFSSVDDVGETSAKLDELPLVQFALKDGELEMITISSHELKDLA